MNNSVVSIAQELSSITNQAAKDRADLNKFIISSGEIYSATAKLVTDIVTLARIKGVNHEFLDYLDPEKSDFLQETHHATAAIGICRSIISFVSTTSSPPSDSEMRAINQEMSRLKTELMNHQISLPKSSIQSLSKPLVKGDKKKVNNHTSSDRPTTPPRSGAVLPIRSLSPNKKGSEQVNTAAARDQKPRPQQRSPPPAVTNTTVTEGQAMILKEEYEKARLENLQKK